MSNRRSHTKSRAGCVQCKRRKVKCDETHPVCFHCKRHKVSCSFSESDADQASTWSSPAVSGFPSSTPSTYDFASAPWLGSPVGVSAHSDRMLPCPPQELWSRDLELMHHFCTVTAHTISARHEAQPIWSVVLPREGYRHSYLLRGILSTAAIHKAFLLPNQRKTYLMLSDYHQAIGLEGYRAQLGHIDDQNWEAMFGFAMLMVLYVMCMPVRSETQRLEDPITSMIELIGVVRGIHSSLSPLTPRLYTSQYAPLIYGTWPQDINKLLEEERPSLEFTRLPPDTYDALDELVSFLKTNLTSHSEKHYLAAVELLRRTVKLVANGGLSAECSAVFSWPSSIHQSIVLDIRNRNPHALVIVAYVAIVMASIEESFWFSRGWGKPLVEEIDMLLGKHDRHLQLLEWPKSYIKKVYN